MVADCVYKFSGSYLQTFTSLRMIAVTLRQNTVVWRQVVSHQATCAIALRLKVVT